MSIFRLLPYASADGPRNMAADETLLETALSGTASLRFYGWSEATLSLGYFQPCALRHSDPLLASLPYVRRPSGGMTLVHHHELTYALALPAGSPWQSRAAGEKPWLCRMHQIIADALNELGVPVTGAACAAGGHDAGALCFRHHTAGDLLLHAAKVTGSAQRRQKGALLQHGAVLLAASPHAPSLPGIRELSGRELAVADAREALVRSWIRHTDGTLVSADWSAAEARRIDDLVRDKYSQPRWNERR